MAVLIDPAATSKFIQAPSGPLGRHMMVIGESIKVRTIAKLKPGFPRDFLGPVIVKRAVSTPAGPAVQVGTDRTHTRPHPIVGNPLLVFFWPKLGRVVHFRSVKHPGSDFTRYLSEKLLEALAETKG